MYNYVPAIVNYSTENNRSLTLSKRRSGLLKYIIIMYLVWLILTPIAVHMMSCN